MRRMTKKKHNLNKLNTGCTPCINEAKKMEKIFSNKNITEMKIDEIKKIISSMFNKK